MTNTLRNLALTTASIAAFGVALYVSPPANAEPASATATVDGVDYPLCAVEDCSDQPGQVGIWTNADGVQWLSLGEFSVRIER